MQLCTNHCGNYGVTAVVVSCDVAPFVLVAISVVDAIAFVGNLCIGARCSGCSSVAYAALETV